MTSPVSVLSRTGISVSGGVGKPFSTVEGKCGTAMTGPIDRQPAAGMTVRRELTGVRAHCSKVAPRITRPPNTNETS